MYSIAVVMNKWDERMMGMDRQMDGWHVLRHLRVAFQRIPDSTQRSQGFHMLSVFVSFLGFVCLLAWASLSLDSSYISLLLLLILHCWLWTHFLQTPMLTSLFKSYLN